MKILYGVQATGNGHISRSRVMAKYLKHYDIDVTYLFSGREKSQLFDMEIFGDYLHFPGLTFATRQGKVDHLATLASNNPLKFLYHVWALDLTPYDLIITDFEPITAWAAKRAKKDIIALGHQYAFGQNTPVAGKNFIAEKILQHFAPAKQSIGLHWSRFNANVFPPIIDVGLQRASEYGSIVVYLPFEDQAKVTNILQRLPAHDFIQYSQELKTRKLANVTQQKTCYQGFKNDLVNAKAVICNSGFELNSECIHLGIPILTKPIDGQMEQESNALALTQLGFGQTMLTLEYEQIHAWLSHLPAQKLNEYPDVAQEIVHWLATGRALPISSLAEKVWGKLN